MDANVPGKEESILRDRLRRLEQGRSQEGFLGDSVPWQKYADK